MLIKGEALISTVTLGFAVSGSRGEWKVTITSPGGITTEDETTERTWFPLFSEMLASAYEAANRRRFPGREARSGATR
jgi:hypothetical protein